MRGSGLLVPDRSPAAETIVEAAPCRAVVQSRLALLVLDRVTGLNPWARTSSPSEGRGGGDAEAVEAAKTIPTEINRIMLLRHGINSSCEFNTCAESLEGDGGCERCGDAGTPTQLGGRGASDSSSAFAVRIGRSKTISNPSRPLND
jgi:hypothetical protein